MGYIALLIALLIGAFLWFHTPALSTGGPEQVNVDTQSIQQVQATVDAINAQNKRAADAIDQ